jgi:hypothetical protein
MKALSSAAILATVMTPIVFEWLRRLPDAIRDALATRAEVSAIMAEAYRRR